jgi:hypothetical protein
VRDATHIEITYRHTDAQSPVSSPLYLPGQRNGSQKPKATSLTWKDEDVRKLVELMRSGAGQLELMQAFPVRRWKFIRQKAQQVMGTGVKLPKTEIAQNKTYKEVVQESNNTVPDLNSRIGDHCF